MEPGTFLQLYLAAIVTIAFMAIETYKHAYATPELNFLTLIYSVALVLTLQGALGFKLAEQNSNVSNSNINTAVRAPASA